MNLMRQICFLSVREQRIFMQKTIQETMPYNHAMEENVHHGMSFILHLNFVHQQTIQQTMINGLVPHFLLMEGSLISQFKEHNKCCVPFIYNRILSRDQILVSCSHMTCCLQKYTTHQFTYFLYYLFQDEFKYPKMM